MSLILKRARLASLLARQRSKYEGKPNSACTLRAFACVMFANISLAKGSHMQSQSGRVLQNYMAEHVDTGKGKHRALFAISLP